MNPKTGRNDPCPCGSGRKYKQCHGNTGALEEAERNGHDGAVERAIEWLMTMHQKAVGVAIDEMLFDGLQDEERAALEAQNQETWQGIQLNATEWLLAEGQIVVRGDAKRLSDCLLGPGGPLFTADQRHWMAQLAERPLRLYDVTDVIAGQRMTLCDALDTEALPITVHEKSGSDPSLVGTQLGTRIMEVDGHYELSGAAYPFSRLAGPRVVARLREATDQIDQSPDDLASALSSIIRRQWLAQYYAPMPIPTMMDAYTGEPLLLITDHYSVTDWTALMQALSTQPDVGGNRESGWNRLVDCKDGQTRPVATINVHKRADRISLFYKTQGYADQGRSWFEALAGSGGAIRFA